MQPTSNSIASDIWAKLKLETLSHILYPTGFRPERLQSFSAPHSTQNPPHVTVVTDIRFNRLKSWTARKKLNSCAKTHEIAI